MKKGQKEHPLLDFFTHLEITSKAFNPLNAMVAMGEKTGRGLAKIGNLFTDEN